MTQPAFDAAGFARFDLDKGTISSPAQDDLALVPTKLLAALEPSNDIRDAARAWGVSRGRLLTDALKGGSKQPGVQTLADHLAGAIATAGLGKATVEIRSDALLVRLEGLPSNSTAGMTSILEEFIGGYLSTQKTNAKFETAHMKDGVFFCGNDVAASKIRACTAKGSDPFKTLDVMISERRP